MGCASCKASDKSDPLRCGKILWTAKHCYRCSFYSHKGGVWDREQSALGEAHAVGLHVGEELGKQVSAYAGIETTLLMAEAKDPIMFPWVVPSMKVRFHGAGNDEIKTVEEITTTAQRAGPPCFLERSVYQVQQVLLQLYASIDDDEWCRTWVQKITVRFLSNNDAVITTRGMRMYEPHVC